MCPGAVRVYRIQAVLCMRLPSFLPGQAGHAPTGMPSKGSRVEVVLAPHHPATAATEGNTVLRETAILLSLSRQLSRQALFTDGLAKCPRRGRQLWRQLGNANVATMLRIRAEQAWARIGQVPYCSHEPRAAADEEAAGRQ